MDPIRNPFVPGAGEREVGEELKATPRRYLSEAEFLAEMEAAVREPLEAEQ